MKPLVLRKILVATDLSAEMLPAIQSARQLADLAGADFHIVHAVEGVSTSSQLDRQIAEWIENAGGNLDVDVVTGPAGASITQEAARTEADVIILGRHRNRAGQPGSTADRIARTARVPCLIVPVPLALPLESVLVPVDVTEAARGELHVALAWASALRPRGPSRSGGTSRVHVLHVRPDENVQRDEDLRARLHAEVTAIQEQLENIAGVRIDQHLEFGDIPPTILDSAQKLGAGLIVIGTRGKRIAEDPLGSVSSAVVRAATGPVLLVPPEVWRTADSISPAGI